MKITLILRLMTTVTFIASLSQTTVDADFFDSMKSAAKKAAHSDIGKMALTAGGAAVAAKAGPNAGAMFQGAAQSMHLAKEADADADEADADAKEATNKGDHETAAQHKTKAAMHRATAAKHREDHATKKKAYNDAGGNFDADYEEHVAPKIKAAVQKQAAEESDDEESDDDAAEPTAEPEDDDAGDSGNDADDDEE